MPVTVQEQLELATVELMRLVVIQYVYEVIAGEVAQVERNFACFAGEIVDGQYHSVAPRATVSLHAWIGDLDRVSRAPGKLGTLLARADETLHIVEQRVGVPSLGCHVHVLKAVGSFADDAPSSSLPRN